MRSALTREPVSPLPISTDITPFRAGNAQVVNLRAASSSHHQNISEPFKGLSGIRSLGESLPPALCIAVHFTINHRSGRPDQFQPDAFCSDDGQSANPKLRDNRASCGSISKRRIVSLPSADSASRIRLIIDVGIGNKGVTTRQQ